jgi:hypothetical protein
MTQVLLFTAYPWKRTLSRDVDWFSYKLCAIWHMYMLLTHPVRFLAFWSLKWKPSSGFFYVRGSVHHRIIHTGNSTRSNSVFKFCSILIWSLTCEGTFGGMLLVAQLVEAQAGRSRFRFPMVSLEFFIDIILPATLWPWGSTQPLTEMSTRTVSWG